MLDLIAACWSFLCQLSPWLLLGLVLSAALHILLPADFVRRRFHGRLGVLQAVAIGVPLPLCSCGVIPAGIGLKNDGADDGSSVGFLISTPQTGVDSILVSVSFFGWPFAIFKMLTALVLGVLGGWLTNSVSNSQSSKAEVNDSPGLPIAQSCCSGNHEHAHEDTNTAWWIRAWRHCLEIFDSIWLWLVIGIFVSALIDVAIPDEWIAKAGGLGTWGAMLLVLLVSVPLYVCATASVPMAAALVAGGFPPAAAMVFLVAGPATNASTIGAIFGRFGIRVLAIYLSVIVLGSLVFGWLFDYLLVATVSETTGVGHAHGSLVETLCSIAVLGLVGFSIWSWRRKQEKGIAA